MAEKPYRPVQEGASMWSTSQVSCNRDLMRVIAQESKMTNQRRAAEIQIKKNGHKNMKPENFAAVLREDSRAYPVYVRQKRKTFADMTIEELFELARHFRRTKRSQDAIVRSGAYNLEDAIPCRPGISGIDREKEKERLCQIMAYGHEPIEIDETLNIRRVAPTGSPKDEFEEVLDEIQERQDFLTEMGKAGLAQQYRQKITQEVVELLNRLSQMDKAKYDSLVQSIDGGFSVPLVNNLY